MLNKLCRMVALSTVVLSGCKTEKTSQTTSTITVKPRTENDSGSVRTAVDATRAEVRLTAVHVAAGRVACAVMSNGRVRCWGRNKWGEIGLEPDGEQRTTPVEVSDVEHVQSLTIGGGDPDGGDLVCATDGAGVHRCWGDSTVYRDGQVRSPRPQIWPMFAGATQLAFGKRVLLKLDASGQVGAWGDAQGTGVTAWSGGEMSLPELPSHALEIAAGKEIGCARVAPNNGVYCWNNEKPRRVEGVEDAVQLAMLPFNRLMCARTQRGTVACWTMALKAFEVPNLSDVVQLAGGSSFCARRRDETVACFGLREAEDPANTSEAKLVFSEPKQVEGVVHATDLAVGNGFACVVQRGDVLCWGSNFDGSLGDGTFTDRLVAMPVTGITLAELPPPKSAMDAAPHAREAFSWASAPAECQHATTCTWQRETADAAKDETLQIASSWVYLSRRPGDSTGSESPLLTIGLMNYAMLPDQPLLAPRGPQLRLEFQMHLRPNESLSNGKYPFSGKQEPFATFGTWDRYERTAQNIFRENGEVTVTHSDAEWVCGTIRNPEHKMDCAFAARRVPGAANQAVVAPQPAAQETVPAARDR